MIEINSIADLDGLHEEAQPSSAHAEDGLAIAIRYLRAQSDGETVAVGIELTNEVLGVCEQQRYSLLVEMIGELQLRRGMIAKEKLEEIEHAAALTGAYGRALSILAFGANSKKSLTLKLRQRGFDAATAAEAVARLDARGYLREDDSARREAERSLSKGWGARRIEQHLRSRGYSTEATRAAIETLNDALQGDLAEQACARLARRKSAAPPADAKERQKLIGYLCRQGYDMTTIRHALDCAWGEYE